MQNFYASHLPKPFAFSSRLQIAHASKSVSFIQAWLHFPGLDGQKKSYRQWFALPNMDDAVQIKADRPLAENIATCFAKAHAETMGYMWSRTTISCLYAFSKEKAFNEDPSQCLAVHHKQEWTTIKHIKLSEQMIRPQQVDLVLDVWRHANFVCPRHPPSNPLRRLVRSRACRTPKRVSK